MNKYFPADLECGHRLWFQKTAYPRARESVWCKSCGDYMRLNRDVARDGTTVWDGYFTVVNKGNLMVGCNHEPGCEWKENARSIADAEKLAFAHIARIHGKSTLLATDTLTVKVNGSEPDF